MRLRPITARTRGFSLVEVMVALIVISVGMLGIAKMQALALSSTGAARLRSLAALQAASLASAMHANRVYWASGSLTSVVNVSGAAVTTADATLSAALAANKDCTSTSSGAAVACPYSTAAPAAMAAYDLRQWASVGLQPLLPNPTASVLCTTVVPLSCTITITWSENVVSVNAQEAQGAAANGTALQKPSYNLYVEP
jgi:type IV pilus assembly protein PilV